MSYLEQQQIKQIENLFEVYSKMAKHSLDNYYAFSSEAAKEESQVQHRIYMGKMDTITEVLKILNK